MADPNAPHYVRVTIEVPVYEGEVPPEAWDWESLLGTIDPVHVVECQPIDDNPEV